MWKLSSVYKSGATPAIILLVWMAGYNVFCEQSFHKKLQEFLVGLKKEPSIAREGNKAVLHGTAMALVSLIDVAAVCVTHGLYASVINHRPAEWVIFAQVGLSVFKIVWQDAVLLRLIIFFKRLLHVVAQVDTHESDNHLDHVDIIFCTTMTVFNTLIAPFIAVLAIHHDCMNALMLPLKPVITNYRYLECPYYTDRLTNPCPMPESVLVDTQFRPPFNYSYQCSAVFVSNFGVIYTYMFLILAVWLPFSKVACSYLSHWIDTARDQPLARLINAVTPRVLQPMRLELFTEGKKFFDKDRFIMRILNCLIVLMTFGAAFPPLAFIACATIFSLTHFSEYCMGRFLKLAQHSGIELPDGMSLFDKCNRIFERECVGIAESMRGAWWVISPAVCIFHTLVIVDTQGECTHRWLLPMLMFFFPLIYQALTVAIRAVTTTFSGSQKYAALSNKVHVDSDKSMHSTELVSSNLQESSDLEEGLESKAKIKSTVESFMYVDQEAFAVADLERRNSACTASSVREFKPNHASDLEVVAF